MSTAAQIAQVYREDQRHPYYSLQSGRRPERMTRRERRQRWVWGHFQNALRKALVEKAA